MTEIVAFCAVLAVVLGGCPVLVRRVRRVSGLWKRVATLAAGCSYGLAAWICLGEPKPDPLAAAIFGLLALVSLIVTVVGLEDTAPKEGE